MSRTHGTSQCDQVSPDYFRRSTHFCCFVNETCPLMKFFRVPFPFKISPLRLHWLFRSLQTNELTKQKI